MAKVKFLPDQLREPGMRVGQINVVFHTNASAESSDGQIVDIGVKITSSFTRETMPKHEERRTFLFERVRPEIKQRLGAMSDDDLYAAEESGISIEIL